MGESPSPAGGRRCRQADEGGSKHCHLIYPHPYKMIGVDLIRIARLVPARSATMVVENPAV